MPEGLEVELYRRAAERLVGRSIATAEADERVAAPEVIGGVAGSTVCSARRIGKLLLLDTDGPVIGVHFGMTGRIIVDGDAPIERLEYASGRNDPVWDRVVMRLDDGGSMRVSDPRRWSRVELDPDESRLGPDLLSITSDQLVAACHGRRRAIKAVLLDQSLVAGLGNLCVDEVLFHAGLDPAGAAGDLERAELAMLHDALRTRLPEMLIAGGSHCGVLSPEVRTARPPCPLDGTALARVRVAGRTTIWCPQHQSARSGSRVATGRDGRLDRS